MSNKNHCNYVILRHKKYISVNTSKYICMTNLGVCSLNTPKGSFKWIKDLFVDKTIKYTFLYDKMVNINHFLVDFVVPGLSDLCWPDKVQKIWCPYKKLKLKRYKTTLKRTSCLKIQNPVLNYNSRKKINLG